MIKSMTGFGRCEFTDEKRKFTVELKSVNHRYLDVNIKMPKKLNFFESSIRALLKEYIERGKVDVYITYEDYTEDNYALKYNSALAAQYLDYLNRMAEEFGLENDIRVSNLSRYPDVLVMEEQDVDEKELWDGLERALRGACEQFVASRIKEGENLKVDLIDKLDHMISYIDFIEKRSPLIMEEYRKRLEDKIKEILGDRQMDDGRIATEVTIYADKVCVDEETVRLRSHINTTKDTLLEGGSIGRKLDFIAQEMNREANTILSKANNIEISDTGINLKTSIEKVREQIQNIE
ncbi:MAG: YicC/YloC family endoribonuclease [Agathobacter sp.]|nr:YicC family protein [Lachnospiraceae bacterium]MDY2620625.1 YicC/YloC family endoribonuclease [Agathobacter sp.]